MSVENKKACPKCLQLDATFSRNKARKDGLQTYCQGCMAILRAEKQYDKLRWEGKREQEIARNLKYRQDNAARLAVYGRAKGKRYRENYPSQIRMRNISRKHGVKQATPVWANMDAMNKIYIEAGRLQKLDGIERHVDHVVPLKHPLVCGLHVPANLEILSAVENMKKHNRFDVGA